MDPIRVRDASGNPTVAVGKVIDRRSLITAKDTVLDPDITSKGEMITLPVEVKDFNYRRTSAVYFPAFRSEEIGNYIILNDMASAANSLLRIIAEWETGAIRKGTLERMVLAYQHIAVSLLAGKSGVIGNNVLSNRVANSGRAVLLINGDHHPVWVGLPGRLMKRLKVRQGDMILVGRDPSIWHGSLEILYARPSGNDCIELHPLMFKQLGADNDGDQVYVYKLPESEVVQQEAKDAVLRFTLGHSEWPPYLAFDGKQVNWEQVVEDTAVRSKITGFSVSPREIVEKSQRVVDICTRMGKDVADECQLIAKGLTKEQVVQSILDQSDTQLEMKVMLGPIGAASNRLKVLAGTDKGLLESAMYVSEWLQQKLLSSKHSAKDGQTQPYSIWDALSLLNRKDRYSQATLRDILEEIERMGLDKSKAGPILAYLWLGYPLSCAIKELFPVGSKHITRALNYVKMLCYSPEDTKGVVERILKLGKMDKLTFTQKDLSEAYWNNTLGLTKICEAEYPVFEITTSSTDPAKRAVLATRIMVDGEVDSSGLGHDSLKLAMAQGTVECSAL